MRVEPELRDHPKFLRLKKIVGEGAMEYLLALWAHCQSNQRGEFWTGVDASYVEIICRWDGEEGVLYKAFVECGRPGFIVPEAEGVRIHDWSVMNSQMVANWEKNPFGRRGKKPTGNPVVNHRSNPVVKGGSRGGSTRKFQEPTGNPVVNHMGNQSGTNGEPMEQSLQSLLSIPSGGEAVEGALGGGEAKNPLGNQSGTNGEPNGSGVEAPLYTEQGDVDNASMLVGLLNRLTGSKFNPPLHELDQVVGRILEVGRDVAGIEKMLRRQVALWLPDPKCRQWLKPGTLFGPRFHDYYGQRDQTVVPAEGYKNRGGGASETLTKTGRPRGEILQQLEMARRAGEHGLVAELQQELAATPDV